MIENFHQVTDRIYRGGAPAAQDLQILKNTHKINKVISLDQGVGQSIAPTVKSLKMVHVIIPIAGPESKSQVSYLKNNINLLLTKDGPVFIHCKFGSDRTGMAIAFYRILHDGWQPRKAIMEALQFGFGQRLDPSTKQFYLSEINSIKKDNNSLDDKDIVTEIKENFNYDNIPPAYDPTHSWAPKEDIKFAPPDDPMLPELGDPNYFNNYYEPEKSMRKQKLKEIIENMQGRMPQVALNSGNGNETQLDLYYSTDGLGPIGTGGFIGI